MKRRRFKQTNSLQNRLTAWAQEVRDKAKLLPPGPQKDEMMKKVRQADIASHLDEWANSPGLQPPK